MGNCDRHLDLICDSSLRPATLVTIHPIILRLRKLSNYYPWAPFSTVRLTLWDLDLFESSSGLSKGHHGRRLLHAALSGQPSAKHHKTGHRGTLWNSWRWLHQRDQTHEWLWLHRI